ncbi:MAG: rhamnulokinase family protein [Candidatus Hermodarchaeota archaeon]
MINSDLKYLAFDLGASSGRAIVGILNKNKDLSLIMLHRFPNKGFQIKNSIYWDLLYLFSEIKKSLLLFVKKFGPKLESIGIDCWGVDYVLLNKNDELAGPVHTYRDHRTDYILDKMLVTIPKEYIFKQTGIQILPINTSTQLFSMVLNQSPELKIAKKLLMIPDYFNFLLSGIKVTEYSAATTTQLYNPLKNEWSFELINKINIQPELFCQIVKPGTILGNVQDYIVNEVGLNKDTKIIAPLCHDTGSAVAAVPVDMNKYKEGEWAYLSSGTWSLIGIEVKEPIINDKALKFNFTNEGGIDNTIRFLKNITGLWIIQECKKIWNIEKPNLDWEDILNKTNSSKPFKFFINPDDSIFLNPDNMLDAIETFCLNHNQNPPKTIGEISRTILESIAFRYKQTISQMEYLTDKKIKILYIIGGGSKNVVLNQFTANALNIPVKTGPSEATAIGNILVQALSFGKIKDIYEIRKIVEKSFQIKEYHPKDVNKWDNGFINYLESVK